MKTKPADIPYCGVREDKIKNSNPVLNYENVKHWSNWVKERYKVHIKKDVEKLPGPWTEDPVISSYRFTNVRREHDRQTINLIKEIVENDSLSLEEKILNSILFRTWNRLDTFQLLGAPYSIKSFSKEDFPDFIERIRTIYRAHFAKNPKNVYWTPVFNTGGLKSAWFSPRTNSYIGATAANLKVKVISEGEEEILPYREFKTLLKTDESKVSEIIEFVGVPNKNPEYSMWEKDIPLRAIWLLKWVVDQNLIGRITEAKDQSEVFELLKEIPGIAGFLAQQIQVDFTYIPEFPFSENEFTFAGPGCSRGVDLLFEDKDGMTHTECLFWLRDHQTELYDFNPEDVFTDLPDWAKLPSVSSHENICCELSKYIKATNGAGRPKNKYVIEEKIKEKKLF